jgi:hypothetical protein
MPVYQTSQLIDQLQQQTELFLNKAVSEWQMLPHHKMAFKQSPEKWSATQCLIHLNSYGNYYLPEIEKSISIANEKRSIPKGNFKSTWLGNYFTNLMQPKGDDHVIKKMKSPKDHEPLSNDNSAAAIATFIDQQERLLVLLEKARSIDLQKTKVPISIAKFIKLQLGDVFNFLVAHNYRHVIQAEGALSNYKF